MWLERIILILNLIKNFKLNHVFREANMVANALANEGVEQNIAIKESQNLNLWSKVANLVRKNHVMIIASLQVSI